MKVKGQKFATDPTNDATLNAYFYDSFLFFEIIKFYLPH